MRKYDGRKNNGRYKSAVKRGPKPLYLQHMSRNAAGNHLKAFDGIASWEQVYTRAWEKGDYALCASIRFRCEDRLYGKPFTAENPDTKGKRSPILNDNRLQIAIQQLLPAARGAQTLPGRRRKALPEAVTIEANPDAQAQPDGSGEPPASD